MFVHCLILSLYSNFLLGQPFLQAPLLSSEKAQAFSLHLEPGPSAYSRILIPSDSGSSFP